MGFAMKDFVIRVEITKARFTVWLLWKFRLAGFVKNLITERAQSCLKSSHTRKKYL